jgi:type I restriction enzyme S subunit
MGYPHTVYARANQIAFTGRHDSTPSAKGNSRAYDPLPSISEQRVIVAELDDMQARADELKKLQGETATELDALLPSILDKAFRGEL